MRRRISVVLGFSLLTASLTACTPSPKPNETLAQMYQDALFDSQALATSQPELASLRTEQAEELLAEIHRICGFDDEGTVPASCEVEVPAVAILPADDPEQYFSDSQVKILDNLDDIPKDSVTLVIEQFIEQSSFVQGADTPALPDLDLSDEEFATAQDLADREFSAAWSLGVALSQAPEYQDAIETAIDNHHERASLLQTITDLDTFAEPGYISELPAPTDQASALETVDAVQSNMLQAWHAAASAATTDSWRVLCAQMAGATARDISLIDAS
ncbi:hypothetical protein [Corynebacterium suranareeae]|nr:hypothetical protein [Corynebacterium suranareeae]